MIKCVIVDDEQHAIDIILHHLEQTTDVELAASFTNPLEALKFLQNNPIDLVFADIQMPQLSGIEFIESLAGRCKVILTTAYSEFAMAGYDLHVVDYLLKPIRLPRFLAAIQKVIDQLSMQQNTIGRNEYFFIKTESKGKLIRVNFADIDYIESLRNYMVLHRGAESLLVHSSMKNLEDSLPNEVFFRVHKSFIISLKNITAIEGNFVMLKNVSTHIPIGENYKGKFMEMIRVHGI